MIIDMWYKDSIQDVNKISCSFCPNEGIYRGNLYIDNNIVGDFSMTDSCAIYSVFPWFDYE